MENYTKGDTRQVDDGQSSVFRQSSENAIQMKVAGASKIRNLMNFATMKMKDPDVRKIVWTGMGQAVAKTITCAEIMKGKFQGLHQITSVYYIRLVDTWNPTIATLDRLEVNKDLPAISILLSKDVLDSSISGYQAPGDYNAFWNEESKRTYANNPRNRRLGKSPASVSVAKTGGTTRPVDAKDLKIAKRKKIKSVQS